MEKLNKYLLALIFIDGLVWLRSSLEKISAANFSLTLPNILAKFAQGNPYPLVKNFLINIALPYSQTFAFLTLGGEFLTALTLSFLPLLFLSNKLSNKLGWLLLSLGLLGGMFLNVVFWFSSAWMSPSADNLNLLMFCLQSAGLLYTVSVLKRKHV